MATTMKLIAKQTLGSSAATVTFSSIPGTATDLMLLISARCDGGQAQGWQDCTVNLNGSSANFTGRRIVGTGSAAISSSDTAFFFINNNNSTANTFSNVELYFPNYAGSTNKSFSCSSVQENNGTAALTLAAAGLWSVTDAITSITLDPSSGDFLSGSSFFLYQITKA